jgi:hypothetical protein
MADQDSTTKRCFKCATHKPLSDFAKAKRNKDGHQQHCKECQKLYQAAYRPKKLESDRRRYHEKKDEWINWSYLRKYGITLKYYNELLIKQGGKCAICRQKCSSGKRLAVDHDHKTGIVRGLLCGHCNTALGKLHDSPEVIKRALDYVLNRTHMI